MTDFPDWQAPQAHATAIAGTGVPLLSKSNVLVNGNWALAASGNTAFPAVAVTQTGYEILINAYTNSSATNPFIQVQLVWRDSTTSNNMVYDTFVIPQGQAVGGQFVVRGRGPTKADTLVVQVNNLDTGQPSNGLVVVTQHSRIYAQDDWRWTNQQLIFTTVPGFTLAKLPTDESCLGLVDNLNIPASSTVTRLFGMYPGLIGVAYQMNTGLASNLVLNMRPQPDSSYAANSITFSQANPAPAFTVAGPRAPVRVGLQNLATTAIAVSMSLFALPPP